MFLLSNPAVTIPFILCKFLKNKVGGCLTGQTKFNKKCLADLNHQKMLRTTTNPHCYLCLLNQIIPETPQTLTPATQHLILFEKRLSFKESTML